MRLVIPGINVDHLALLKNPIQIMKPQQGNDEKIEVPFILTFIAEKTIKPVLIMINTVKMPGSDLRQQP
jgi:hypothetical protein